MRLAAIVALLPLLLQSSGAFAPPPAGALLHQPTTTTLGAISSTSKQSATEHAANLRAQAEHMRLEAAQMDAALTLNKIAILERRLNDQKWLDKHPDQEEMLLKQLAGLNNKTAAASGKSTTAVPTPSAAAPATTAKVEVSTNDETTTTTSVVEADGNQSQRTYDNVESTLVELNEEQRLKSNPLEGFAEADLSLFLPVALDIEATMPDATVEEQLVEFRQVPSLQEHFQKKIQELLTDPMDNMQEVDELRAQYLESTSSIEKDSLKRQIDRLEAQVDAPFEVSNSFYRGTKPMSAEELDIRIKNLQKLPRMLQGLFMRRNGVLGDDIDLELGVLMEHYDEQLQLLDQVRYISPLPQRDSEEAMQGFESLPPRVQEHFVKSIGLEPGVTSAEVIQSLGGGGAFVSTSPMRIMESATFEDLPEYNDIEFIERSQYVEELIPSITSLEAVRPTQEEIDYFVKEIVDSKTYKLRSKPERVYGGYYIRGFNAIRDNGESGSNDQMVARLNEKLAASKLAGRLQFFFVPDPKALTDEEIDMAVLEEPVLLVTGNDPALLYRQTGLLKKLGISAAGLFSLLIFSLGTCELNDIAMSRLEDAMQAESVEDILHLTSNAVPVGVALTATQLAHEGAHRIVAWKDKFKIGFPNIVPSIQLGLTGTITPLESPPKNFKSLFDFAIAGPLAGFITSFALLTFGLEQTVTMDLADQSLLPALPMVLLKASALGGSAVEFFLGNGVIDAPNPVLAVLPMHPFAVAGFVGILINALALLPLGHTDGGRIALSLFGRRGTYLLKSATFFAICVIGLFGFDEARILIVYAMFTTLTQRELEAPVQNEVDEIDEGRALLGFMTAMLVTLTLLPMP